MPYEKGRHGDEGVVKKTIDTEPVIMGVHSVLWRPPKKRTFNAQTFQVTFQANYSQYGISRVCAPTPDISFVFLSH